MTSQQILQSDLLDILFEKRNKLYGAYTLRRSYPAQMLKAIGITTAFVLLLIFLLPSSSTTKAVAEVKDSFTVTRYDAVPVKKQEAPKPRPQLHQPPPARQANFTNQLRLVDKNIKLIETQDKLNLSAIGNEKVDAPLTSGFPTPPKPPVTEGNGSMAPPEKEKELVTRQPQFPGGAAAWSKFLNTYLHSPQDLEPGEKRTVSIQFHVDVDGTITNFKIIQSGGELFDNEVIRVLKKMPRWMPALQAGQPIAVPFTQPVTFVGSEE